MLRKVVTRRRSGPRWQPNNIIYLFGAIQGGEDEPRMLRGVRVRLFIMFRLSTQTPFHRRMSCWWLPLNRTDPDSPWEQAPGDSPADTPRTVDNFVFLARGLLRGRQLPPGGPRLQAQGGCPGATAPVGPGTTSRTSRSGGPTSGTPWPLPAPVLTGTAASSSSSTASRWVSGPTTPSSAACSMAKRPWSCWERTSRREPPGGSWPDRRNGWRSSTSRSRRRRQGDQ